MGTILKKFKGVVNDIEEDVFIATLEDIDSGERFIAEILINKVPLEERQYIKEGTSFFWSIVKEKIQEGRSIFSFLRPTYWTKKEITKIEAEAKKLYSHFHIGEDNESS